MLPEPLAEISSPPGADCRTGSVESLYPGSVPKIECFGGFGIIKTPEFATDEYEIRSRRPGMAPEQALCRLDGPNVAAPLAPY